MERYEIAIAAERAGTTVEELRQLVELGILQPDADGRFSDGDVRRVGVVQGPWLPASRSTSWRTRCEAVSSRLTFMDDPAYDRFASLTSETFQELSARTGLPLQLLIAVREATGGVTPAPEDRLREGERPIVPSSSSRSPMGSGRSPSSAICGSSATACVASPRPVAIHGAPRCIEPLFAAGYSGARGRGGIE